MKKLLSFFMVLVTLISTLSVTSTAYAASKPAAPKGVSASVTSCSKIKVCWKKVSGAKGYYVRYSKSKDGSYKSVKITKGSTTSRTITGLASNTKYYFKVAAYNKKGTGKNSAVITKSTTTRALSQKQQFNTQNANFNFNDSKYAYIKNNCMYYSTSMGAAAKKIATFSSEGYYTGVTIKVNYIYYLDSREGNLCRMKNDGTAKRTILTSPADDYDNGIYYWINYIIVGDYIYYVMCKYTDESDTRTLYRCSLTGGDKKKITAVSNSEIYYYSGKLYMMKGSKLGVYTLSNQKVATYSLSNSLNGASFCGMDGTKLYFMKVSADYSKAYFYKIDTASKNKVTRLATVNDLDPVHNAIIYKDKIYVSTGTGAGNAFATISAKGRADYDSYRKKYDMLGDGGAMGFYKNYICGENYDSMTYKSKGIVKLVKCY